MSSVKTETPSTRFAEHWATELGASALSLERLRGGINNQVYRCGDAHQFWVIKGYEPKQNGTHDRMQAEVDFLRFAAQAAPDFTPALIQVDHERRCVVLEHIEGKAFPEGVQPSEAAVAEAVEFFRQLNAHPQLAKRSINLVAAEGCLSLREHLGNVHERLGRMTYEHLDPQFKPLAETLLRQLQCKQLEVEERTSRMINQGMVTDEADPDLRCISPSDFGFHNAIQTDKKIYFIDFEFAGWDDPAKAAQDFILQPRVPVARELSPLLKALPLEQQATVHSRCEAIGPILELKWACIQLAILQPRRLKQIQIVTQELKPAALIQRRLEKVSQYLKRI